MGHQNLTQKDWHVLLASENLDHSPGHMFRVLENKIHEVYYQITPRPDISPRQIAVLLKLYQVGGATQTELAEMINLDRSTLSEMGNRMCHRGLLRRTSHARDGRASLLQLTEAGRAALQEAMPAVMRAQREIMQPLPDEYRPLFLRSLAILYRYHTQAGGGLPASSDSQPETTPAEPKRRRTTKTRRAEA